MAKRTSAISDTNPIKQPEPQGSLENCERKPETINGVKIVSAAAKYALQQAKPA
jgi:hypothetical protein